MTTAAPFVGPPLHLTTTENEHGETTTSRIRFIGGMPHRFTRTEHPSGDIAFTVEDPTEVDAIMWKIGVHSLADTHWTLRRQFFLLDFLN